MKTNLDGLYKTNVKEEKEGIWMEVTDGVAFHLRRFGGGNSDRVKQSLARHHKPHARRIESGTLSAKKENEIMAMVFVDACLIDWKGVEVDGKKQDCTKDNAVNFFTSLPELLNDLFAYSTASESFKDDLEAVGNS